MKEQALIGARGLVSPSLCIPVLQSVSCYRGAAVMPFSRRLWRVLGEVGLADEVGGMEAGLHRCWVGWYEAFRGVRPSG